MKRGARRNIGQLRYRIERGTRSPHCQTDIGRFMSKVHVSESGCWEWGGVTNVSGYGQFKPRGQTTAYAHRWITNLVRGIPDGFQVDHLCRNRRCVNPDHLESVTPLENIRRSLAPSAVASSRGTCQKGHPMAATSTGRRYCRPCQAARARARYVPQRAMEASA